MTEPSRGPALRELTQTSRDLITWTTERDLRMVELSDGQGEIVGHARFTLAWGEVAREGQTVTETISEPPALGGLFVRICREDGGGTVVDGDVRFEPCWWGKMLAPEAQTSGGNGITTYTAAGIASVFNERSCWHGRAISKTSPLTFSIAFQLPPFNHWPSGDRSADGIQGTVGGVNVYLHDARNAATGYQWTAGQILSYLLACNFRYEQPPSPAGSAQAGPSWSLSDPDGCLDYTPGRFDALGKTFTEVLNELAGKKRGLTWWVTVAGSTLTIHVASGLVDAITIGTTTIPANSAVWDQLDATDPYIHPLTIATRNDEVADEIIVRGGQRRIGITLAVWGTGSPFTVNASSQLDKGWSDAAETACNTYLDTLNAPQRRTTYDQAWRRFILRAETWNGAQQSSGGMPDSYATVTSAAYGSNGIDGTVSRTGLSSLPGQWYSIEGDLPCAVGFTALNVGPRQRAVIVAEDDVAGTWVDHSNDWTMWVEPSPPAIVIDDGDQGATIRDILQAGRKIMVSVTLRDFWPFQVMWRRDPANWPTSFPRTKTIEVPDLTQEYLLAGMTTGVDADGGGALTVTGAQVTTRDNLPQLRALLAQARAWYEEPYQLVSFTDRGVWSVDPAFRPGTILGAITDGVSSRTVNAMVTRRTVRLEYATAADGGQVPYWSTTWETDVVYPDMEAVL